MTIVVVNYALLRAKNIISVRRRRRKMFSIIHLEYTSLHTHDSSRPTQFGANEQLKSLVRYTYRFGLVFMVSHATPRRRDIVKRSINSNPLSRSHTAPRFTIQRQTGMIILEKKRKNAGSTRDDGEKNAYGNLSLFFLFLVVSRVFFPSPGRSVGWSVGRSVRGYYLESGRLFVKGRTCRSASVSDTN